MMPPETGGGPTPATEPEYTCNRYILTIWESVGGRISREGETSKMSPLLHHRRR